LSTSGGERARRCAGCGEACGARAPICQFLRANQQRHGAADRTARRLFRCHASFQRVPSRRAVPGRPASVRMGEALLCNATRSDCGTRDDADRHGLPMNWVLRVALVPRGGRLAVTEH
jgi:hypothetical protein